MPCVPIQHTSDEVELLMQELQLRMRLAVEGSPRLHASLQEPHVLYTILAEFFELQLMQSQRKKDVALDVVDVRRVWAFCLAELASSLGAPSKVEAPPQTLYRFVHGAPSLPLEALQRGAPVVNGNSSLCAPNVAVASSVSRTTRSGESPTSVFSIIRSGFAGLMDLAYVSDQRLQRPSSSGAISVVSLAAIAASLVPTLDRVQSVRLTAQIADDLVDSHTISSEGSAMPPYSRFEVATLLAGVWYVWGVLDTAHSTTLHSLGEHLFQQFATPTHGRIPPAPLLPSFAAWLRCALRENNGALHQQLYAVARRITPPAKTGTEGVDAVAAPPAEDQDPAAVREDVAADSDFWARLAS
ncbi:hypothetical protein Q4I30_004037 [Leishmania utingensis]|uniref:Uncharacterized protein n=1 Tax=Leishmania utingensis TaxID=653362 RepID=A0AAW3AF33_9TRYP